MSIFLYLTDISCLRLLPFYLKFVFIIMSASQVAYIGLGSIGYPRAGQIANKVSVLYSIYAGFLFLLCSTTLVPLISQHISLKMITAK